MKFTWKQKSIVYLLLCIFIGIIGPWLYQDVYLPFLNLNTALKQQLIISFVLAIVAIFVIIFFYTMIFNQLIFVYLDAKQTKENLKENFPYMYKFLFNKVIRKGLEIFSIYIIWNYSLYINHISDSMIIAFLIFLPSIFVKKKFQIPTKDIVKTLFLAVLIYIFSHFLTKEPQIKISLYNIYMNDKKPVEALLSIVKAILHFEFYISFWKIIHTVIDFLLETEKMKKN